MNKDFNLKLLKNNMGQLEYDMFQEIPSSEPGAENAFNGLSFDEFKGKSKDIAENENRQLDDDGTPVVSYIMYVDKYPVGIINIRTEINEYWAEHSGNIYYTIRPSQRKKGYGTKMLGLVLDACRKLGFNEVLIQSSNGNIASAKTIENNGGILLRDDHSRYYKIILSKRVKLNKLSIGDRVAIVSPSNGLPEKFPWVQDLGLKRLTEDFGLMPKEYPTTRKMNSSLRDRARDIMTAFADPENKAVFASIGGLDQIKLIKYLDLDLIASNPKPFFGYSDNTHLHNTLWNLGIPSYYGGNIMTNFAFNLSIDSITANSIKNALFNTGEYEIEVSDRYNDVGTSWADKENLDLPREFEDNEGLYWDGDNDALGILWGGCAESLIAQVASNKYLPKDSDMDGVILFIETAEDIPEHWIVEYLLIGFGERGWLNRFSAILVGRPKAWEFNAQNNAKQKADYKKEQREMILRTVRQYNQDIPVVQNLDFGHTTPQLIIPSGNIARIDSKQKRIFFTY